VAARATNRPRVANALQAVCLAGAHRRGELEAALAAMAAGPAAGSDFFLVMLASPEALTYRGLYALDAAAAAAGRALFVRVHGAGGPAELRVDEAAAGISGCFKYSTGQRRFEPLLSLQVGLSTDAVTLKPSPARRSGGGGHSHGATALAWHSGGGSTGRRV